MCRNFNKFLFLLVLVYAGFNGISQTYYSVQLNSVRKYSVENPVNNEFSWKIYNVATNTEITDEAKFYDNYDGVPGITATEITDAPILTAVSYTHLRAHET